MEMVSKMAVPVLMITLGGGIYIEFKQKSSFYWGEILKFVLVKNVLFPCITLCLLCVFKPGYSLALVIFLQSAVPPITALPVITERAGGNKNITNQLVLASFVFSLISIPAGFLAFQHFFK